MAWYSRIADAIAMAVEQISSQVKNAIEIIEEYKRQLFKNAGARIVETYIQTNQFNPNLYKRELWKAYNIALMKFVEERFGKLAGIGTSEKWSRMKASSIEEYITAAGGKRRTKPQNRDAFGYASDYLIEQIYTALLSDDGISPGFRTVLTVASDLEIDFDWEIRLEHFYHIPFKGGNISYPQFLDDLLRGDIPYVDRQKHMTTIDVGDGPTPISRYVAYGAFRIGLLGMTPAEREALNKSAIEALSRILGAAAKMTQRGM